MSITVVIVTADIQGDEDQLGTITLDPCKQIQLTFKREDKFTDVLESLKAEIQSLLTIRLVSCSNELI